jgi:hypothetical protein
MLKTNKIKRLQMTFICFILFLTGCGSSYSNSNNASSSEYGGYISPEVSAQATYDQNTTKDIHISLESALNRKIIKTGELYVETKTYEQTINQVLDRVKEIEGFTEHSSIEGNRLNHTRFGRSATMIVRIPNKHFETFIYESSDFGNVTRTSVTGEDITDAYMDIEGRLESLQIQQERLFRLLENSGSLTELLEIEKALAEVSYNIERIQGSLNKYDSLIDYATVTVYIEEVVDYTLAQDEITLIDKMKNRLNTSFRNMKSFGEELLLLFVGLIPVFVFILLPIGIVAGIVYRFIKKNKR